MATTASGTSSGGAAAPRSWGTPAVRAAVIGTGLIGLALRVWILFLPGLMSVTQYDDGPYFGSAVRLDPRRAALPQTTRSSSHRASPC